MTDQNQFELSSGAMEQLLTTGIPGIKNPVLQVLGFELMLPEEKYRLKVHDGRHASRYVLMSSQLNRMVVNNEIKPNAVIRVDRFKCETVKRNKKVLILLDLTVLHTEAIDKSVIGESIQIVGDHSKDFELQTIEEQGVEFKDAKGSEFQMAEAWEVSESLLDDEIQSGFLTPPSSSHRSQEEESPAINDVDILPIASLSPRMEKWTIRARVIHKSAIEVFKTGNGKLISVNLLDQSGEIRAVAFTECCDKFFDIFMVSKIYDISCARVRRANPQYSTLNNKFELILNCDTQAILRQVRTDIPRMQFKFVSLDQLKHVEINSVIDVIGVCTSAEDLKTGFRNDNGTEYKRRDLHIVDQTGAEVLLTLWGTHAESFDDNRQPVVAVKGVQVREFHDRSLSMIYSSSLLINPKIEESHSLHDWYKNDRSESQTSYYLSQSQWSGDVH